MPIGQSVVFRAFQALGESDMNANRADVMDDLAGRNGEVQYEHSVQILDGPDGNRHFTFPAGTTAQRPSSPSEGMMRFNTTEDWLEWWDGTAWRHHPVENP